MKKFSEIIEESKRVDEGVKLPKFTTKFIEELERSTFDPAELVADLILEINNNLNEDDFWTELKWHLKAKKLI